MTTTTLLPEAAHRTAKLSSLSAVCLLILVLLSGALHLALWNARDDIAIFPDSIHQLSIAENVLQHEGLSTSVLHYPDHYLYGTVPVPQTVWPPGMGLGVAALTSAGMSPLTALKTLTFVADFLLPIAVFFGVAAFAGCASAALLAGVVTLSLPSLWSYSLRLMSEPTFTLLTLLSLILLAWGVRRDHHPGLLLGAATLAALSFLVRYAGLFYIAASGIVLLATALLNLNKRTIRGLVLYAAVSGLAVITLFSRNLLLRHQVSGGQFSDTDPLGFPQAILRSYWLCKDLVRTWLGSWAPEWLLGAAVVAGIAVLGWMLVRTVYRFAREPDHRRDPVAILMLTTGVYALVTAGVHLVSAALYAGWFLTEPRYFVVLFPLVVLACGSYVAAGLRARATQTHRAGPWPAVTAGALTAALLLAQVGLRWSDAIAEDHGHAQRHARFAAALSMPMASSLMENHDGTIGEYLRQRLNEHRAVLSQYPESLYLALDRPSVGLVEGRFARIAWTDDAVLALLCRLPIDYVLVLRPAPGWHEDPNFFRELLSGAAPPWLHSVSRSGDVALYAVDRGALGGQEGSPRCQI